MAAKAKKKNPLTEHWFVCIVIPVLGIAAALFAVFYEKPKTFLPNPLLDQAEIALVEERHEEAIAKAEQAKAVEPDNPRIYLVIYAANELSDRHEEAVQALQEGTEQIKKSATGGKEIRAVLAAAEISPEEGLAEVVESYSGFDILKDIAKKILQMLVRVFPDSERFAGMLGEVTKQENGQEKDIIPEDVFNEKYMEAVLGVVWDDIYAVAAKLGITRASIDEVRTNVDPDSDPYGLFWNVMNIHNYSSISTYNSNNPISDTMGFEVSGSNTPYLGYNFSFQENVDGIIFPHGTYIGMSKDEVIELFNNDEHNIDEQQLYRYNENNIDYSAFSREYDNSDNSLDYDACVGYNYTVSLHNNTRHRYSIQFYCQQGIVKNIALGFYTEPIEEAP